MNLSGYGLRCLSFCVTDSDVDWKWKIEKGQSSYNLWTIFRGSGILKVGDRQFTVEPGISVLIAPGYSIEGWQTSEELIHVIAVHFDFLDANGNVVTPEKPMSKRLCDVYFFRNFLNRMVSFANSGRYDYVDIYLRAILCEFYSADTTEKSDRRSEYKREMINDMCNTINGHIDDVPSLSDFARKYGYSEAYLGRIFCEKMGIIFSRYVINARLNQAKYLLKSTELPIETISETLGYSDKSFFVKQFSKYVGSSPGKFRKG